MVSVPMSNNDVQAEELQKEQPPPNRPPHRSYSWTHDGPLNPPDPATRRFSAVTTPVPKPMESTFWKPTNKVLPRLILFN